MKKFMILIIIMPLICACSIEDDDKINEFYTVLLPIDSASLPETFTNGETYDIYYNYLRPTECHIFNDLYHYKEGNIITIAVINTVFENPGDGSNCTELDSTFANRHFDFEVSVDNAETSYIFKFWQGENEENGEDIYLTIEVPVLQ
jgi:hypothetical protein